MCPRNSSTLGHSLGGVDTGSSPWSALFTRPRTSQSYFHLFGSQYFGASFEKGCTTNPQGRQLSRWDASVSDGGVLRGRGAMRRSAWGQRGARPCNSPDYTLPGSSPPAVCALNAGSSCPQAVLIRNAVLPSPSQRGSEHARSEPRPDPGSARRPQWGDAGVRVGQENTPDSPQAGEQTLHSPRMADVSFHAVQTREDVVTTWTPALWVGGCT